MIFLFNNIQYNTHTSTISVDICHYFDYLLMIIVSISIFYCDGDIIQCAERMQDQAQLVSNMLKMVCCSLIIFFLIVVEM